VTTSGKNLLQALSVTVCVLAISCAHPEQTGKSSTVRSALDDLVIEEDVSVTNPGIKIFSLRNLNTSRPIRATVEKRANDNFSIDKPDRSYTRNYYPVQDEIRVPPGGKYPLGRQVLTIITKYLGPPTNETRNIRQEFVILGASYLNSWPPPPVVADPESFVWVRSVPIVNNPTASIMDVAVNSHWSRPIEYVIVDLSGNPLVGHTLLPEKQTYFNPGNGPGAYRIRDPKFAD
jgi:hypothetical protein